VTLEFRISVVGENPTETEEYQLERQATAHKQAGDWASAIDCLRRAQAIRGPLNAETRLAKYLQQAGFFDVAMQEIQNLIDGSHAWAEGNFGHRPPSMRRCQQAGWLVRLHKDAALICKREKQKDRQAHHEAEAKRWRGICDLINPIAELDRNRDICNKATHPYLRLTSYACPCELHHTWNNLVLPLDHPFWQTHWPPKDGPCRCRITSMTQADYEKGYSEYRPNYEYNPDGTVKNNPEIERVPFITEVP